MTSARTWEVVAVRYATLASTREGLYYRWAAYGEPDACAQAAHLVTANGGHMTDCTVADHSIWADFTPRPSFLAIVATISAFA